MTTIFASGKDVQFEKMARVYSLRFENGALIVRVQRSTFEQLAIRLQNPPPQISKHVSWDSVNDGVEVELRCSYAHFANVGFDACMSGGLWNATTAFLADLFNDLLGTELLDLKEGARLQPMMITSISARPDGEKCDHGMSISISLPTRIWLLKDGAAAAKLATAAMQEAARLVYPEFAEGGVETAGVIWNAQTGLTGITACALTCACVGVDGSSTSSELDTGFALSAHNLDHAWEQLIIFAGLATLWNLAEERLAMR